MAVQHTTATAAKELPRAPGSDARATGAALPDVKLAAFIGCLIILALDTETLTVIPLLGDLQKEYGMSPAQGAWSLSATGVAAAATVPLIARLGDVLGMRRMLLATLLVVATGSLICALATGPSSFIFGRVVVGINAGLPLYYAMLRSRSDSAAAADRYVGSMTVALGTAVCISILLGGVVTSLGGSVRVVLWIIAGLALCVVAVVYLLVPDSPTRARVRIDYLGALLLAGGLAALVIGIGQANAWGWGSTKVLGLLAATIVLLAAWWAQELRAPHPLIKVARMVRRDTWPGFVVVALAGVLSINGLLLISNFVRTAGINGYGFGASVLSATLFLLPAGLMIALGGNLVAPIARRLGLRVTVVAGGLLAAVAWLAISLSSYTRAELLVLAVVLGIYYSLIYTAGSAAFLRAARPGEQGMVTGSGRAVATAAAALGPAIVTALLTASTVSGTVVPREGNYGHAALLFCGLGVLVALVGACITESAIDQRMADDAVPRENPAPAGTSGGRA